MRTALPFTAIVAAALLALTGCATGPDGSGGEGEAAGGESSVELSAEGIISAMEADGYGCDVEERHPKTMSEVLSCRQDGVKLIFNKWVDLDERAEMYNTSIPQNCKTLGFTHVHWSTSGDWLIVPASTSEGFVSAFTSASEALGFETHDKDCA